MLPPKHPEEEARLAELYRYGVLDTEYEQAFDDLTRLAAQLCEAPIAVINLIDHNRQWFKSHMGLGVRETPLDVSICAHAILQEDVVVVPDTLQDARFVDNSLVTGEPHLRFYAGALLQSSGGQPIGTLCVLDYKPRTLTAQQVDVLRVLSREVMAQLELRLQIRQQAEEIAQRQSAEEALRLSETRFRAAQEAAVDGFMILESVRDQNTDHIVDFRWVYVNEAATHTVGRPGESFLGKRLLEELPGHNESGLFDAYVQVVETGQPKQDEFDYNYDGLEVYVRATAVKVGDGFAVSFADLSERRQTEIALQESEARLRGEQRRLADILNGMDEAFVALGPDFQILRVNPAAERINQKTASEFVGKIHWEEWPISVGTRLEDEYRRVMQTRTPAHFEHRYYVEGVYDVWLDISAYPDENTGGINLFYRDITARKSVEKDLQVTAETLEAIYDTAPVGLCVLDTEFRWVRINERLAEINGFPASQHIGKSVRELLPGVADQAEQVFQHIVETGEPVLGVELIGETPAQPGVTRIWLENWLPFRDSEGNVVGINIVAEEITERKAQEVVLRTTAEALQESEKRFRIVAGTTSDAIWDWNLADNTLWWNEGVTTLFGYTREQIPPNATWWYENIHPEERERVVHDIHGVIYRSDSQDNVWSDEYRFRRADGTYAIILDKGRVLRGENGQAVRMLGAMQDVTETRETERRERFLVDLSERTHALTDPEAVSWETVKSVGEFLNVGRCAFIEVNDEAGLLQIQRNWTRPGVDSVMGVFPIASFGEAVVDVLRANEPLIISNTVTDERISEENKSIYTTMNVYSVLDIPVHRAGRWVGILAVNDTGPRVWTWDEVSLLSSVTERAWLAWENARLWQEREEAARKNEYIAETLQRSLLVTPNAAKLSPRLDIGTEYQAAWEEALIGGDFYDAFCLDGNKVALIVGDATGKGLQAAEHIAEVKYALRAYLRENSVPANAMMRLNNFACAGQRLDVRDDVKNPMPSFVAVAVAVLDTQTGTVQYTSAGMEPPLIWRIATGKAEEIFVVGQLIGADDNTVYDEVSFTLSTGDVLALATDGLTEARQASGSRKFFGVEGLTEALQTEAASLHPSQSLSDAARAMVKRAVDFAEGRRADDMCLLLARYQSDVTA